MEDETHRLSRRSKASYNRQEHRHCRSETESRRNHNRKGRQSQAIAHNKIPTQTENNVQAKRKEIEDGYPTVLSKMNILNNSVSVESLPPNKGKVKHLYAAEGSRISETVFRFNGTLPWMSKNELVLTSLQKSLDGTKESHEHFKYDKNGRQKPNRFVDVPASNALVTRREASDRENSSDSVNVEFKIIEIDKALKPMR
eukprot:IDg14211t1